MTGPPGRRRLRPQANQPVPESSGTIEEVARALGGRLPPKIPTARVTKPRFSLTEVSPAVRTVAVLFGVYLCYAVLRIQELYPFLNVDRLPLFMSLVVAAGVMASTPMDGWRAIWHAVPPIRWQALIVVLGVVTAPVGIWMSGSLTSFLFTYTISVIVFVATVVFLRDRRTMTSVFRLLLIAVAAISLYTLGDSAKTAGGSARVRLGVTLDPNDLAMLLVAMTPLALYMAQRKGARSVGWMVVAGLSVSAIVPTQSRGAVLGLGAVAVALIAMGTGGWKRTLYLILTIVAAVGIFTLASALGADRLSDFSDYEGGESRTAIWKRGLVWMSWRPWGYGMDNFPIFFGWLNDRERAAHNSFIEIGVELGLLGLLAFSMLWLHTARDLIRQRRHALSLGPRVAGSRAEATLATMILATMAGTAGCGFFLSKAYAGITLFAQGLGIATLLGYPFRTREMTAAATAPLTPAQRRQLANRTVAPAGAPPPAAPPPIATMRGGRR